VAEGADAKALRTAFLELTKIYHPAKFAREPVDIVREANEVFLSLRAAYEQAAQIGPRRPGSGGIRATPAGGVPILAPARANPPTPRTEPSPRTTPARGAPITPQRGANGVRAEPAPAPASTPAPTPTQPIVTLKPPGSVTTRLPAAARSAQPSGTARSTPGAQPTVPRADDPASAANTTGRIGFVEPPPDSTTTEEAEREVAMGYLRKKQWSEARKALHALAARVSADDRKRYRALLSYARGREAQDLGRHEDARAEFTRALQLDPDLGVAKAAMAQVGEEPAERPSRGLLSRLFKK